MHKKTAEVIYVNANIITMNDAQPRAEALAVKGGKVLGPDQRITAEEGLKALTTWAAWQHFEESLKGSLEPGKLADMVVLSDDPLKVDPMKIADIKVLQTIKEGVAIYKYAGK